MKPIDDHRKRLLAKLHILLKQTGAENHKEELYAGYGVESSRDMTDGQLCDLIGRLENGHRAIYGGGRQPGKSRAKCLSDVLAVLSRMGITEDTTKTNPAERWQELNEFVRSKNKARKAIPEMNEEELRALFVILRAMECKGWKKRQPECPLPPELAEHTCYVVVIPKDQICN